MAFPNQIRPDIGTPDAAPLTATSAPHGDCHRTRIGGDTTTVRPVAAARLAAPEAPAPARFYWRYRGWAGDRNDPFHA